eukprot:m.30520 g.30520  ORF g.30520 m.30520 type:complete len:59 (+) comp6234_c0_seq2:742-918(+)
MFQFGQSKMEHCLVLAAWLEVQMLVGMPQVLVGMIVPGNLLAAAAVVVAAAAVVVTSS